MPTSASPSASETVAVAGIDLDQDVPGEPPVVTQYDGELRPLAEIHHMECLEAAAGDQEVPTVETGDQSNEQDGLVVNAWSATEGLALPADWKFCVDGAGGYLVVPASFSVDVEEYGEGGLTSAVISDADDVSLVTFTDQLSEPSFPTPEEFTVLDVSDAEYMHTLDEQATEHLRTSVSQSDGDHVMRVELISVPAGEDPESADHWGFGELSDARKEYVATIPVSSTDRAQEVMDALVDGTITQMLHSYQPPVQ